MNQELCAGVISARKGTFNWIESSLYQTLQLVLQSRTIRPLTNQDQLQLIRCPTIILVPTLQPGTNGLHLKR